MIAATTIKKLVKKWNIYTDKNQICCSHYWNLSYIGKKKEKKRTKQEKKKIKKLDQHVNTWHIQESALK